MEGWRGVGDVCGWDEGGGSGDMGVQGAWRGHGGSGLCGDPMRTHVSRCLGTQYHTAMPVSAPVTLGDMGVQRRHHHTVRPRLALPLPCLTHPHHSPQRLHAVDEETEAQRG